MISTLSLLQAAERDKYAVPAFNIFDESSLQAVMAAAKEARSPVIIQVSTRTVRMIGVDWMAQLFRNAAAQAGVPAALHLDHCPDVDIIRQVVKAEWSSLLFDASHLGFEEAVRQTAEVVRLAHANRVEVESEVENIVGVEDGIGVARPTHSYSAERIVAAAREARVDFLAPHLGTAHGEYHGRPQIQPERAAEFRRLCAMPIVLHGGTGLTTEEFRSFIDAGVSKINISTAVKRAYMQSALAFLETASMTDEWEPGPLLRAVHDGVREAVAPFFDVFGSAGKAESWPGH